MWTLSPQKERNMMLMGMHNISSCSVIDWRRRCPMGIESSPLSQSDASGRDPESEQLVKLLLTSLAVLLSNDMLWYRYAIPTGHSVSSARLACWSGKFNRLLARSLDIIIPVHPAPVWVTIQYVKLFPKEIRRGGHRQSGKTWYDWAGYESGLPLTVRLSDPGYRTNVSHESHRLAPAILQFTEQRYDSSQLKS